MGEGTKGRRHEGTKWETAGQRRSVLGMLAGVTTIEVITEQETGRGWEHRVAVVRESGVRTEHTVRLSWADHEHWSGGRDAPSRVIQTLMELLVEREGERAIPATFDAAAVRRWWPGMDARMQRRD